MVCLPASPGFFGAERRWAAWISFFVAANAGQVLRIENIFVGKRSFDTCCLALLSFCSLPTRVGVIVV